MSKKSFLLYKTWYAIVLEAEITQEQKGDLFDAIFLYQIEGTYPRKSSPIYMLFIFVRNQFQIDDGKYDGVVERNKVNGEKGGRPKKNPPKPKEPTGLSGLGQNPSEPKKPDTDTGTGNVTGTDTGNDERLKLLLSRKQALIVSDQIWLESMCMQAHLTAEQMTQHIARFLLYASTQKKLDQSIDELKGYFSHWANKNHFVAPNGETISTVKSNYSSKYAHLLPKK